MARVICIGFGCSLIHASIWKVCDNTLNMRTQNYFESQDPLVVAFLLGVLFFSYGPSVIVSPANCVQLRVQILAHIEPFLEGSLNRLKVFQDIFLGRSLIIL